MPSHPALSQVTPEITAQTIYATIADKVRVDSRDLAILTHVESLGPLFPDMTPEEIVNYLTEMHDIKEYDDIRALIAASGDAYLYSSTSITAEEAAEKCLIGEVRTKIADKVRKDSKANSQLTATASLAELFPDIAPEQIEKYREAMKQEKGYADIQFLVGPTGIAYLYSESFITSNYATMLARVDAKDACSTIADTVRDESRIYPRPTKVELFYAPIFQIDPGQMQQVVERTLQRPECADIKKIVAPTGAVYLYSNRYMEPAQAERWVQWEEVERLSNP